MADTQQKGTKEEQQVLERADIDALAQIVDGLKQDAEKAAESGNKAAAKMYQMLVKQASPIVTRGYARLQREELAALNKKVNPPKFKMVRVPIDQANTPK